MFIGTPCCELAEVCKNIAAVSMENMWTIFMYKNSIVVIKIKSITADMASLIDNQHFFICLRCQSFSQNCPGKACSYYQIIKHMLPVYFQTDLVFCLQVCY